MDDKVDGRRSKIYKPCANNVSKSRKWNCNARLASDKFLRSTYTFIYMYIADDFIAHSWSKIERSYLASSGLCGCVFFFFFVNCYSPHYRDIILSPTCARYLAYGSGCIIIIFFPPLFPNYYNRRIRWQAFYVINHEPIRTIIPTSGSA